MKSGEEGLVLCGRRELSWARKVGGRGWVSWFGKEEVFLSWRKRGTSCIVWGGWSVPVLGKGGDLLLLSLEDTLGCRRKRTSWWLYGVLVL